ncbi:hypothetical protein [Streptomyces sp. CA-132043]|uniref:hypothetical protein n=1 Tax=Streptomyces sp. CA-132043 TaxID=3240048 RepID=UPI003D8BB001
MCQRRLADDIRGLPGLYRACEEILGGRGGAGERVSGGPLPGMPFNTAAAEARSAILTVLGSWAGLIAETYRVPPPARAVPELAAFLLRHLGRLTTHGAAHDASAEAGRLVRKARSAIESAGTRAVPVGACPEPACPGQLTALIRADAPERPTAIRCRADSAHEWAGHEWLRLRHRLREARPAEPGSAATVWLTAADISRMWSTPTGSVYRLAGEGSWRRHSSRGRTFYHEADVVRTMRGRRSRG